MTKVTRNIPAEPAFTEVVQLIEAARKHAFLAVNTALIERTLLRPPKVPAVLTQFHPDALNVFKDAVGVEYALSRSLSPALIAENQTQLPDKKLLQAKLHEFYLQNLAAEGDV